MIMIVVLNLAALTSAQLKGQTGCPDFGLDNAYIDFGTTQLFEGCTPVSYCMVFINNEDFAIEDVLLTFTASSQSNVSFSVPYNLGGFTHIGNGVYTKTITIPPTSSLTVCISFTIDPAFSIDEDKKITGDLLISHPECAPIPYEFNALFPDVPVVIGDDVNDVTDLSSVATADEPFEPGLLVKELSENQGQNVLINGTLVMDLDYYYFPLGSDIMLAPGAKVVVPSGSHTLHIIGQSVVKGCTDMWQEISVGSGATLDMFNAGVEDGLNGILALNGSNVGVTYSHFLNNRYGITTPSGTTNNINFNVYNNDFQGGSLKGGGESLAGMYLNDVALITTGNSTYQDLVWGIYGNRSNIYSFYDYFKDMSFAGIMVEGVGHNLYQYGKGKNKATPSFEDCFIGIRAINVNVTSRSNAMRNVERGVSLSNGQNRGVWIVDNIIEAQRFGISFNNWNAYNTLRVTDNLIEMNGAWPDATAIFGELLNASNAPARLIANNNITLGNAKSGVGLFSCTRLDVRGNLIEMENSVPYWGAHLSDCSRVAFSGNTVTGPGVGSVESAGLYLQSSSTSSATCNCFDQTKFGAYVYDDNRPFSFRGNGFNEHDYGLKVGDPASGSSGPMVAYTGEQPHYGNHWDEVFSSGEFGGVNYATEQADLLESQFRIAVPYNIGNPNPLHPPVTTGYLGSSPSGAQIWFFHQSNGSTYSCTGSLSTCPDDTSPGDVPDEISDSDIKVADGAFEGFNYPDAQQWKAKRHLYRRLSDDPDLIRPNTVIDTFYTVETNTTVGEFDAVRQDIEAALTLRESLDTQLQDLMEAVEENQDSLLSVMGQLQDPPSQQDSLDLLDRRGEILQVLDSLFAENEILQDSMSAQMDTLLETAYDHNDAISVSEIYEQNEQVVNAILIGYLRDYENGYTQQETDTLRTIAAQCPLSGGDAVYTARAMLGDTTQYDDVAICQQAQPLVKPAPAGFSFDIQPNPARDFVVVQLSAEQEEPGNIQLINQLGVVVFRELLPANQKELPIAFPDLPAGLYRMTIHAARQEIASRSFVLVR
jgi:hypothetical protein